MSTQSQVASPSPLALVVFTNGVTVNPRRLKAVDWLQGISFEDLHPKNEHTAVWFSELGNLQGALHFHLIPS